MLNPICFFRFNLIYPTVHLQIEELTRKLRSGDLGIPPNPEDRFVQQQHNNFLSSFFDNNCCLVCYLIF